MKIFMFKKHVIMCIAILAFAAIGYGQETEAKVIDEVVAQVNDSVVLLSQINREVKSATDSFVQQGKSAAEAKSLVEAQKGQLIANLINEELMIQRGTEAGMDKDVDAKINSRFLEYMKQFNLKTLDELYAAMRQQGVDPDALRAQWKRDVIREDVFGNFVDGPTYWGFSEKELKDFYQKNAAKFKKPATVSISEIFLSFAGKNPAEVKTKAAELVKQLRSGGNFAQIAVANSDRPDVSETLGKNDKFVVSDLDPKFATAIEKLPIGGITDPIEVETGIEIIKVDGKEKGSEDSEFDENKVRTAMLQEKLPEVRRKFLERLFNDAYIKIREEYRPIVMPFLTTDTKPKATASN